MNTELDEFLALLSELSPMQFEEFFVFALKNAKRLYDSVQTGHRFADPQIDIVASTPDKTFLFELKVSRRSVSQHAIKDAAHRLNNVAGHIGPHATAIIVVNTFAPFETVAIAIDAGVEIWQPADIFNFINNQTSLNALEVLMIFTGPQKRSCRDILNDMLDEKKMVSGAGKPAFAYQKLAIGIFSCLFSPPLAFIDEEVPDEGGKNRRDAIYENISDHHYWSVIRDHYDSMYVVVDAKNHKNKIPKNEVVKFSHYLKHYGCGHFGILICRKGLSSGAWHAARDQWIGGRKMIVALSHDDLETAVKLKEYGQDPVEVIFEKIKQMRIII